MDLIEIGNMRLCVGYYMAYEQHLMLAQLDIHLHEFILKSNLASTKVLIEENW